MIQKISARQTSTQTTLHRPQDAPDEWGHWNNNKYYDLEVVQHPIRARMCGFGDKDRRPLAPAAVVKMVVKKDDNTILDVDDIDCSFFVVTVDLWSADGKQEMNLVMHPSATERFNLNSTAAAQKRRRGTSISAPSGPSSRSGHHTPSNGAPSHLRPELSNPSFPSDPWNYPSASSQPQQHLDRTTGFPPPTPPSLPSISTFSSWGRSDTETETYPYRPSWNNTDMPFPNATFSQDQPPAFTSQDVEASFSPAASNNHPYFASFSSQSGGARPTSPPPGSSAARPTYTRTLVGPLSSNATRLLDEHRKPGIFFLFQDLSVRTEGTFRLRMRLMNVGAIPAPDPGATQIHMGSSPVLAQVFSEPFTVYSAKRFPGVPDTTALSIALGNQGQKLPLRNRHGSNKRRQRDGSDDDDDSDGA